MSNISYFSLGGQDEKGRYSGVLDIDGDLFILNAGIGAEFSNHLGIKKIIPDTRYLKENVKRIKGIFIGCAKNINIGALPYFLISFGRIPIYTSGFGKEVIESYLDNFFKENGMHVQYEVIDVKPAIDVQIGSVKVCGVKTPSSIPNSYSWVFKSLSGEVVVFLDEFVLANENRPCCENQLHLINQQAKGKVSLLLLGAQNAGKVEGFSYPLAKNFSFLKRAVASTKGRVLVSLYEDDWNTLLNLSNISKIYSMNFHISSPRISELVNKYIDSMGLDDYAKSTPLPEGDNVLVAITGDNEDLFQKLRDIDEERDEIRFNEGDLFLISTITLPENEYEEIRLLNDISRKNIVVVKQPKSIVSYSAGNEDIKFVVNTLYPYNIVPVDGYYKDFINVYKALEETIDVKRIKFLGSGERIELSGKSCQITNVPIDKQFVNEEGILDINNMILSERQLLEKYGLIIVSVLYNVKQHLFYRPTVVAKAFLTDDHSQKDEIYEVIQKNLENELARYLSLHKTIDMREVKSFIREGVFKSLKNRVSKKPVILSLITKI